MGTKACGIVCEYDPFHNGHAYMIRYVRASMGLPVVCAMSGEYVQRAHLSCMDKRERARIAAENGAEIVLEIPFPYACLSAERFAAAGVAVLDGSGMCSHIAFGAECTDAALLSRIADFLLTKQCEDAVSQAQKASPELSYAAARETVIKTYLGCEAAEAARQPNNILGIEYIKAIRRSGSRLIPVPIERTVSRADGKNGIYASSSHIRALLSQGKRDEAARFMPVPCVPDMQADEALRACIFYALRVKEKEAFDNIAECGGGLGGKLYKALQAADTYEQTAALMRCKTLTDAKIRRMLLFAYFGVTQERAAMPLRYTTVLSYADTDTARALFATSRKEKNIAVCSSGAAARHDKTTADAYRFAQTADHIASLLRRMADSTGKENPDHDG